MRSIWLLVLVCVSGMTSLALEICASRLLAAYFGTSLFIWGNLIGLVLLSLTIGYALGGRLADRYPSLQLLCLLTAIAALAIVLLPFVSQPILALSMTAMAQLSVSTFFSSLLGTVLLFALPITLLGVVSPFAIRLSTKSINGSGRMGGSLYAVSTAGSIIGSLLPALALIPQFGVQHTLLIFSVILFAASLWGLKLRWYPFLILLLISLVIPLGPLKAMPNLIYHQESLYNYIQVIQQAGERELILNEGQAIHSIYYNTDPDKVLTGWYWDYFLAAPYFNRGFTQRLHRIAIIGLAGGTIAHQFTKVYGPLPIDGVEIDPAIVDVGRKYFHMNEPNLHVYAQDGRAFFATTHKNYDVVAIDAFQQPYIPFQLTTHEFFSEVRSHLSSKGVVALNTGHTAHDNRLIQAFVNTMSTVFPSVYVFNVPNTFNTEIMATMRPTSLATFQHNMRTFDPATVMGQVANEVVPVARRGYPDKGIIFTDDQAPIEQITDQLLLNYLQQ